MELTFLDFYEEEKIDYIVLAIDAEILDSLDLEPIVESQWRPAAKKGWTLRVDPEMPQMNQQRHVHITKTKYINAKNKQFSWNQDGTRHDKHAFSHSDNCLNTAKKIAQAALGVDSTAVFESNTPANKLLFLCENINENLDKIPPNTIYLKIK